VREFTHSSDGVLNQRPNNGLLNILGHLSYKISMCGDVVYYKLGGFYI